MTDFSTNDGLIEDLAEHLWQHPAGSALNDRQVRAIAQATIDWIWEKDDEDDDLILVSPRDLSVYLNWAQSLFFSHYGFHGLNGPVTQRLHAALDEAGA